MLGWISINSGKSDQIKTTQCTTSRNDSEILLNLTIIPAIGIIWSQSKQNNSTSILNELRNKSPAKWDFSRIDCAVDWFTSKSVKCGYECGYVCQKY